MAYASWSVVFGEQPSAAKWNILGTNDASFNNGTGIPSANAASALVATSETTTSTSYADLTTTTDTVTVTIGITGLALVCVSAYMANNTADALSWASVAVSGATTLSAADSYGVAFQQQGGNRNLRASATTLLTGLTPGSTTFKMKYKVQTGGGGAGTGTFANRRIAVIPL